MVAVPDRGFVFTNWIPVSVFTFTEVLRDPSGATNIVSSTVASPLPQFTSDAVLKFTMQPVEVLFDRPGVMTVTLAKGWQANFVPARKPPRQRGQTQRASENIIE
jgi:hypothetical protein